MGVASGERGSEGARALISKYTGACFILERGGGDGGGGGKG